MSGIKNISKLPNMLHSGLTFGVWWAAGTLESSRAAEWFGSAMLSTRMRTGGDGFARVGRVGSVLARESVRVTSAVQIALSLACTAVEQAVTWRAASSERWEVLERRRCRALRWVSRRHAAKEGFLEVSGKSYLQYEGEGRKRGRRSTKELWSKRRVGAGLRCRFRVRPELSS